MKNGNAVFAFGFWVIAAIYLALVPMLPFQGSFLIKTVPIWGLLGFAFIRIPGSTGKVIALALLFSSVGDVVLTLHQDWAFLVGLGSFLLAHVTYCIAFGLQMHFERRRFPFFVAVVALGCGMSIWLAPHLGAMAIPVFAYITVITTMVVFSGLRAGVSPILMVGALSFMASDTMLAIGKFIQPFAGGNIGIMATYYLAQFLIVWAFIFPIPTSRSSK